MCVEKQNKSILKNSKKKTKFKINILRGKTTTTLLLYPDFPRLKFFKSPRVCPFSLRRNKQTNKIRNLLCCNEGDEGGMSLHPRLALETVHKTKQKKKLQKKSTSTFSFFEAHSGFSHLRVCIFLRTVSTFSPPTF